MTASHRVIDLDMPSAEAGGSDEGCVAGARPGRKGAAFLVVALVVGMALGGVGGARMWISREEQARADTVALVALPGSSSSGMGLDGGGTLRLDAQLVLVNAGPAAITVKVEGARRPGVLVRGTGSPGRCARAERAGSMSRSRSNAQPHSPRSRYPSASPCRQPTTGSGGQVIPSLFREVPGRQRASPYLVPCRARLQPLVDGGELGGGLVATISLSKRGGHCPVALEAVDVALHRVTLLVEARVQGWWPAAFGSLGSPVCALVGLARVRRGDVPLAVQAPPLTSTHA